MQKIQKPEIKNQILPILKNNGHYIECDDCATPYVFTYECVIEKNKETQKYELSFNGIQGIETDIKTSIMEDNAMRKFGNLHFLKHYFNDFEYYLYRDDDCMKLAFDHLKNDKCNKLYNIIISFIIITDEEIPKIKIVSIGD